MRDVARQPGQRPGQDIGENQIVRRASRKGGGVEAIRRHCVDQRTAAIGDGIFAGDADRDRIDVGRRNAPVPQFGRADGQQPCAAAEVEHIGITPPPGKFAQRGKTERGGFVMAGAEGKPGFDAHRDNAIGHLAPVVGAIDEEAARAHRRQAFLREADPVRIRQQGDMHGAAGQPGKQIAIRRGGIKRLHHRIGGERVFGNQHGLRRGAEFESGRNIGRFRFLERDRGFPEWRCGHGTATYASLCIRSSGGSSGFALKQEGEHGRNDDQRRHIAIKVAHMLRHLQRLPRHDAAMHQAGPHGEPDQAAVGGGIARGEDEKDAERRVNPDDHHVIVRGIGRALMPGPARRPDDRQGIDQQKGNAGQNKYDLQKTCAGHDSTPF